MNIHVAKNGEKLGPYTEEEVRARISSGDLTEADLGWREGLADWQPLSLLLVPLSSTGNGQSAAPRKSSGLAKASFIIAMIGIGIWVVLLVLATSAVSRGLGGNSPLMAVVGLCMFAVMAANLVGIIFGLIALPKPVVNKWMAITGLTVNSIEILGIIFLMIIGSAMK